MARYFTHGFFEQFFSRRKFVPGRSAGWVRQRDKIDNRICARDPKFSADDFVELFEVEKLHDCEAADGDGEARAQDFELFVHP
ncbi:MAG: hypothetical protein QOE73_2572 [Verrucomicrobiota bacterium]